MWFLTTHPLIWISVIFAEFTWRQDCRRVLEDLYRHEKLKFVDENSCFLMFLDLSIGCNNRCWVSSSSAEFRSFLLSMCIDALESTRNYLSSGFFDDAIFRASLRAHLFLLQGFFLSSVLEFWSVSTTLVRFPLLKNFSRWTLSFPIFTVCNVPFEKCTLRFGAKNFVLFCGTRWTHDIFLSHDAHRVSS